MLFIVILISVGLVLRIVVCVGGCVKLDFDVFVYAFYGGIIGMLVDVDHIPAYAGFDVSDRFLHGFALFVGFALLGLVIVKYLKDN